MFSNVFQVTGVSQNACLFVGSTKNKAEEGFCPSRNTILEFATLVATLHQQPPRHYETLTPTQLEQPHPHRHAARLCAVRNAVASSRAPSACTFLHLSTLLPEGPGELQRLFSPLAT